MPPPLPISTGLTITNPLVLYRALLSTKRIDPDPAQHRLAIKLQELYHRLKDYTPQTEYGDRLKAIGRAIGDESRDNEERTVAVPGHPLRRNPLFAHLFRKKERHDTLAMTRVLTSHEAAIQLDSPRGLLLHGEVGTGKSMLLDLLADSLPNRKKRRWHFNTFMLETLARLEQLRKSRSEGAAGSEHSLLWLARDMIENSPILFLDEFQLPDRASSKILSNLLTSFFQLGGVLIASSNRMPDELSKASGMDFGPPTRGLMRNWLGFGGGGGGVPLGVFPGKNEYASFVEVLKSRCEIWEMQGGRDVRIISSLSSIPDLHYICTYFNSCTPSHHFLHNANFFTLGLDNIPEAENADSPMLQWRRREVEEMDGEAVEIAETMREQMIGGFSGLEKLEPGNLGLGSEESLLDKYVEAQNTSPDDMEPSKMTKTATPKKYLLKSSDNVESWNAALRSALPFDILNPIPWESTTLLVYGRQVAVPRHLAGVTYWDFQDLCCGAFGPADYITLASTFHTLALDEVPVLHLLQKNEARRLITLLDALYEARCKLIIRAEAGPDGLFFPETQSRSNSLGAKVDENDGGDAVYPETISEIYQDRTSPFRPNISSYTDEPRTTYDPNEDSDFGPIPGKGNEIGRQVDFGMTSSFTGEDEKFAYKRARSRLWEMCGARWHARSDPGWWRPLPVEIRRWERSSLSIPMVTRLSSSVMGDVKLGESFELDKPAGLQGKELEEREKLAPSPFREK